MLVTPSMSVHATAKPAHGGGEPEEGFQAGERRAQPARSRSTSASTVTSGADSLLFLTNDVRYPDNHCKPVRSFVIDHDLL